MLSFCRFQIVNQTKDEALQILQNLQAEHSELMEAKRVSSKSIFHIPIPHAMHWIQLFIWFVLFSPIQAEELHLADTMKVLENVQAERDEVKKEQTLLDQNLKLVKSSLEAEIDDLRQRLEEKEACSPFYPFMFILLFDSHS